MGEGHLAKFVREIRLRLFLAFLISGLILGGALYLLSAHAQISGATLAVFSFILLVFVSLVVSLLTAGAITKPTQYLAQSILHISPSEHLVAAPNMEKLSLGRELVTTLVRQVYDFASGAPSNAADNSPTASNLFDQLPVAVIGMDEEGKITLANRLALQTIKLDDLVGRQLKDTLQFLTEDEPAFTAWLQTSAEKSLTAQQTWQKVDLKTINNDSLGYFDIAASFNKNSASGIETLISFYDHSDAYRDEAGSISFVAMAVHELRSPLTIMRGYIEAFEDELGENANEQLKDDLKKMTASAENLASFVAKILNVARVDQGQLSLSLQEDDWNKALPQIIDSLRNRAGVYGKTIELRMQPGMPTVAIDRIAISEVVVNLIDNAIKYSRDGEAKITVISQVNKDGMIETTVQDQGIGIPASIMPHLFNKFQRNHRNRATIGGTGLGLYLSKAIITAHNGNIWASSKENEGSTFGFTLLTFASLAKDQQTKNNGAITRSSHGWIKNHSMQRR